MRIWYGFLICFTVAINSSNPAFFEFRLSSLYIKKENNLYYNIFQPIFLINKKLDQIVNLLF